LGGKFFGGSVFSAKCSPCGYNYKCVMVNSRIVQIFNVKKTYIVLCLSRLRMRCLLVRVRLKVNNGEYRMTKGSTLFIMCRGPGSE